MAALASKIGQIKNGWLLVKVENGSPRRIREARILADGSLIEL
jgi:hypothetical protein